MAKERHSTDWRSGTAPCPEVLPRRITTQLYLSRPVDRTVEADQAGGILNDPWTKYQGASQAQGSERKSVCSRNVRRTTIQHCRICWDVGRRHGCRATKGASCIRSAQGT